MKKSFGEKLKQARNDKKLKQSELAKQLGVTNTTVSNWENNISKPDLDMLSYICGALEVKVSYFLEAKLPEGEISISEFDIIKKYRALDAEGKSHVDIILSWETDRMNALGKLSDRPAAMRIYTYLHKIAAAGTGFYFEDIPTDTIEAPYCENADFIIGVSGDSMEPTYNDGDLVYVEKCQIVNTGDIGIFIVNNELYIKEAGENGLISHNSKYDPIPGSENILCVGKVLKKVNAD